VPNPNPTALIISLKSSPNSLPNAFRQIERWANSHQWQPLKLAVNWLGTAQVFQDAFGFVHLHGSPVYTGTAGDGTVILNLPPPLIPATVWQFMSRSTSASPLPATVSGVDINPNGVVTFRTSAGVLAANPTLDVIYDPRI